MQKKPHPSSTIKNKYNTIDWNTKAGKELTHEALEANILYPTGSPQEIGECKK